jgi:methionine synthase II (cobalamin-independent)
MFPRIRTSTFGSFPVPEWLAALVAGRDKYLGP